MKKNELQQKCSMAKPFLAKGSLVPILNDICFTGKELCAFNDTQGIALPLETKFTGGVPGELLIKLLATFSVEDIKLQEKGAALTLQAGKTKVDMPLLSEEEFVFEIPDFEQPPIALQASVITGLELCLISVGRNPAQLENNGVTWQIEGDRIIMYSTDGDTISRYVVEKRVAGIAKGTHYEVILPTLFCEQLCHLVRPAMAEADELMIHYDDEQLVAKIADFCDIYTRTIPNISNLEFEAAFGTHLPDIETVNWLPIDDVFKRAIDRATLISGLTEIPGLTEMTASQGMLSLFTRSSVGGHAQDEIECDHQTTEELFTAKFNPNSIKRVLDDITQFAILPTIIAFANDDLSYIYIVGYAEGD